MSSNTSIKLFPWNPPISQYTGNSKIYKVNCFPEILQYLNILETAKSNKTRSTRPHSRNKSTPLPLDTILLAIGVNTDRTLSINLSMPQTGHDPHTIPWTINATTTGGDLVSYNLCQYNITLAINWSMPQTEHDPHGYKFVNYQHLYHWAQSL